MVKNIFLKTSLFFLPAAFLPLLNSCSQAEKEKAPDPVTAITDSLFMGDSDIRHFNFGMMREEFDLGDDSLTVLANERDYAVESIQTKAGKNVFAECSYRFENDLLQSGEINIFTNTDSLNKQVQDTLIKKLNKRFGKMIESRGFYTWKSKSKKGYTLEVFMGDVSQELGSPGQSVTGIRFYAELIPKALLALLYRD